MLEDWYKTDLPNFEWTEIDMATLSNDRLGKVGFKLGLDQCASKFLHNANILSGSSLAPTSLYEARS
jgi:hypothetical protein